MALHHETTRQMLTLRTQAVANLKLPKVELEKAEWDFNVKRSQGGFIKKVEARQV